MSATLKNVVLIDKGKVVGGDTLRPHLVISATTGATVIVKKGVKAVRATETSTGVFECDVPEFGTWVVNINGTDGVSVVIDKVKIYQIGTNTKEPRDITNELSSLSQAIAEQDLEKYGYKIGDYFLGTEQTPYVYTLADLDMFYGGYNTKSIVDEHHIGVVVNTKSNTKWNNTDDATGGYASSVLQSFLAGTVLDNIKADMIARFGGSTGLEHLISHYKLFTNGLNGWAWVSSMYISALTECQVFGCQISSANNKQQGEGLRQLDVFRKYSFPLIVNNNYSWLRTLNSNTNACYIRNEGYEELLNLSQGCTAVGLILLK